MSADKRKQILIVFAALAVVLVGVIAYVSPNFRNEDVSGSIGAVQKHRAPQIQAKDVVLGDESVKQQQQVLYADFLSDAAALRSMSANISTLSAKDLRSHDEQLGARYAASMTSAVAEAKKVMNADDALDAKQRAKLAAEADALGAAVDAKLSNEDMEAFSARITVLAKQLSAGKADLINSVGAEAQLDAKKLQDVAESLEARGSASRLRDQAGYLDQISKQAKAVGRAADSLDSRNVGKAVVTLQSEAQELEAKAIRNMEEQLASDEQLSAKLGRMVSAAGDAQARATFMNAENELAASSKAHRYMQLGQIESQIGAKLQNEAQLARFTVHLARLGKSAESKSLKASALGESQEFAARLSNLMGRVATAQVAAKKQ